MLTRYQVESELSLAYLHAVAAKAAFSVDVPHIDNDSVDATICAKGLLDPDSTLGSPKIDVQLKATINHTVNGEGNIAYPLSVKNYDDLRRQTMVPRLLVLLCLPADEAEWLIHHPHQLVLQKCAYWVNLSGQPPSINTTTQTVYIPAVNMLTPDALRDLMRRASKEDLL